MSDIGQEDFRVEIAGGKYTAVRLVGGGTRWLRHDEPWEAADASWQHSGAINALIDELHEARSQIKPPAAAEPEIRGEDGTVRKAHYGAGRQPWDDICDEGWGPAFAAGNALKYVRRHAAKNGADDLAKGRWYYHEIITRATSEINGPWTQAFGDLEELLTVDERRLLRAAP